MKSGRLEAFSDGVLAIVITIMVLELRVPEGTGWNALRPVWPVLLSYVLSFVHLGIYWSNHHHLFQAIDRVNGKILWANLHLLFWLSLVPFTTRWLGESEVAPLATAVYGIVLLFAAAAYFIVTRALVGEHGPESEIARILGSDMKGWVSILLYASAVPLAWVSPWISLAIYVAVAVMWLIPERRIEKRLATLEEEAEAEQEGHHPPHGRARLDG